jgi:hypothetical protein
MMKDDLVSFVVVSISFFGNDVCFVHVATSNAFFDDYYMYFPIYRSYDQSLVRINFFLQRLAHSEAANIPPIVSGTVVCPCMDPMATTL